MRYATAADLTVFPLSGGIVRNVKVKKRPTPAKVGRSYSYYEARREGCRRCNKAFG